MSSAWRTASREIEERWYADIDNIQFVGFHDPKLDGDINKHQTIFKAIYLMMRCRRIEPHKWQGVDEYGSS